MIRINIYEAKAHLSEVLERVERGETILLCRRNVPIAELRPLTAIQRSPRPLRLAHEEYGNLDVPASFFEPLPADLQDAFEGKGS